MKAFWKALGIAALAVAVPVRYKKDEETGVKTFQSLLLSVDVDTDEAGKNVSVGVNVGDGLINSAIMNRAAAKKEAELFTDDPEEAVLIADDLKDVADETQEAADEGQAIADEAQEAADEGQAIADAAQEAADEADFDPKGF